MWAFLGCRITYGPNFRTTSAIDLTSEDQTFFLHKNTIILSKMMVSESNWEYFLSKILKHTQKYKKIYFIVTSAHNPTNHILMNTYKIYYKNSRGDISFSSLLITPLLRIYYCEISMVCFLIKWHLCNML